MILSAFPGRWVAVDAANHVRCDAPSFAELLDVLAVGEVGVAAPGAPNRFAAIIDTGGPITVAAEVLSAGGDPVERTETMMLRLGGSINDVPLYDLTLEVRPPSDLVGAAPVAWRGVVAVVAPWPHHGTAVILGQTGFLDAFTATFGPDGFVLEPASVFRRRFPLASPRRPKTPTRGGPDRHTILAYAPIGLLLGGCTPEAAYELSPELEAIADRHAYSNTAAEPELAAF